MANSDSSEFRADMDKESYADDAKARRVLNVNDDLSGLLYMRVGVGSKVENRTNA